MGIPFKSWNAAVKDVIHRQQNSREVFLAYQFFFAITDFKKILLPPYPSARYFQRYFNTHEMKDVIRSRPKELLEISGELDKILPFLHASYHHTQIVSLNDFNPSRFSLSETRVVGRVKINTKRISAGSAHCLQLQQNKNIQV